MLAAGTKVHVTLTAEDSTGAPVPGATIYLMFLSGGGSARVGRVPLNAIARSFTTNSLGVVTITYIVAQAPVPTTGDDDIVAKNAASHATITAHDVYFYNPIKKYVFSPSPIATTGSLTGGATVTVGVFPIKFDGSAAPNFTVYVSFVPAPGGGSATVGGTALTSSPSPFVTDSGGKISVAYTTPATPPAAGTDLVYAQNTASRATVSGSDGYTY